MIYYLVLLVPGAHAYLYDAIYKITPYIFAMHLVYRCFLEDLSDLGVKTHQ